MSVLPLLATQRGFLNPNPVLPAGPVARHSPARRWIDQRNVSPALLLPWHSVIQQDRLARSAVPVWRDPNDGRQPGTRRIGLQSAGELADLFC